MSRPVTRRDFLNSSTGVLAGGLLARATPLWAQVGRDSPPGPAASGGRSVVVVARSDHVVAGGHVRHGVLDEMMFGAVTALTEASTPQEGWRRLIRADEIVGVRFETQGAARLGTNEPLSRWLLQSLLSAGWPPERIVTMGASPLVTEELGVRRHRFGWTAEPLAFGSGSDHLSGFVEEVDAILSVPFLKNDNITGMSGCLKAASYHLLKHPARYHAGGGSPFLGDVLALPILQQKLRLHLLNGLRTVFAGGPLVYREMIADTGTIILSRDPLAADVVGLEVLNVARRDHEIEPIALDESRLPALIQAARQGLGRIDSRRIEKRVVVIP